MRREPISRLSPSTAIAGAAGDETIFSFLAAESGDCPETELPAGAALPCDGAAYTFCTGTAEVSSRIIAANRCVGCRQDVHIFDNFLSIVGLSI